MKNKRLCIASAIVVSMLPVAFGQSAANAQTAAPATTLERPSAPAEAIEQETQSESISNKATKDSHGSEASSNQTAPPSVPLSEEDKMLLPWNEMNLKFRESYAKARKAKIAELGPIVIFKEDKIILQYKNKREEFLVIPARYTLLKSVSHIALGTFVILEGKTDSKLDPDTTQSLSEFRASVEKAISNLEAWKLSPQSLARQKAVISASTTLIDNTLKNGTVSAETLLRFTRAMAPLVLENAYDSISMELEIIDSRLKLWKDSMPADDWKRIRIAVLQPHMPRSENSIMQYLLKMLKQKYEGESIVYGEGRSEEEYAIDLIGTHTLDKKIAIEFFNDPWRMHRDLLSDGAKRYLKNHTPVE
ncbi:MAG: hypothetical protein SGJ27_15740 [Candidatus Melainabacteria bacterium]|nr:hypothetical protein [Candidatus Melainabacteria bacterium]